MRDDKPKRTVYGVAAVAPGGRSGAASSHALSNEAYTDQELTDILRATGFTDAERFPSLSGKNVSGAQDLPVVGARS